MNEDRKKALSPKVLADRDKGTKSGINLYFLVLILPQNRMERNWMSKKYETLDDLASEFIEVVHSSTVEERELLVEHLEQSYLKTESQKLKVIFKRMIDYVRSGKDEKHEQKN